MLTIAPWTLFWERNYFAHALPSLGQWMENAYVRGGVTGIGLVTVLTGLRDLSNVILARGAAASSNRLPPAP